MVVALDTNLSKGSSTGKDDAAAASSPNATPAPATEQTKELNITQPLAVDRSASQLEQSSAKQVDLFSGNVPKSTAQTTEPNVNDRLIQQKQELENWEKKTIVRAEQEFSSATREQEGNRKQLNEMGALDRLFGTKAAQEKTLQASDESVKDRQENLDRLQKNRDEVKQLHESAETLLVKARELESKGDLAGSQKLQLQANEFLEQGEKALNVKQTSPDFKKQQMAAAEAGKLAGAASDRLDNAIAVTETTQTLAVVAAATAITVGTGGLAGVAMGAGGGALVGAGSEAIEQTGHVKLGNKTADAAMKDWKDGSIDHLQTATTTAISAGLGMGVAHKLGSGIGGTLSTGQTIANGMVAGATGGASNSLLNNAVDLAQGDSRYSGMKSSEIAGNVIKDALWSGTAGALGGGVGATGNIARSMATSTVGKAATVTGEVVADGAIGVGVEAARAKVENRDFSRQDALKELVNAGFGTALGEATAATKGSPQNTPNAKAFSNEEMAVNPLAGGTPKETRTSITPEPKTQASTSPVVDKIDQLKPGEKLVIGRNNAGLGDDTVSRQHATLERQPDNSYIVRDGADGKNSKNGTFYYDNKRQSWEKVRDGEALPPGTQLRLGKHSIVELPVQKVILPESGAVEIGRKSEIRTPSSETSVSRIHAQIEKTPNGYLVKDQNSLQGTFVKNEQGEWRRITADQVVKPGDQIRLGEKYVVELAKVPEVQEPVPTPGRKIETPPQAPLRSEPVRVAPASPVELKNSAIPARVITPAAIHPSSPDMQVSRMGSSVWEGPDPESLCRFNKNTPVKRISLDLDGGKDEYHLRVYGNTTSAAEANLKSALGDYLNRNQDLPGSLHEIHVVPDGAIGNRIDPKTHARTPIKALSVDEDGRLIVSEGALATKEGARQIIDLAGKHEGLLGRQDDQSRERTRDHKERAVRNGIARPAEDHDYLAPNGRLESSNRPIIGRDMENINGSVYLGAGDRPAIVVDDVAFPQMRRHFEDFVAKRMQAPAMTESEVLDAVLKHVRSDMDRVNMDYHAQDRHVMDLHRKRTGETIGRDQEISLHEYVDAGVGVCAHRALYAGYLLNKLSDAGVLNGTYSFERNSIRGVGAHAWIRYTGQDGAVQIMDPMQHTSVIPLNQLVNATEGAREWLYMRESDVINARQIPIGTGD